MDPNDTDDFKNQSVSNHQQHLYFFFYPVLLIEVLSYREILISLPPSEK